MRRKIISYFKKSLCFIWNPMVINKDSRRYIIKFLFRIYSIKCLKSIISFFLSPWFDERNFENFVTYASQNQVHYLFNEHKKLHYCAPVFYHTDKQKQELTQVNGPNNYAAILDFVSVIGSSNLILLNQQKVLYDLKYNDKLTKYQYTDEAIRFYCDEFCILDAKRKTKEFVDGLQEGIFMGGNYSSNYYHLFFEILVKFEQIDVLKLDATIPLLVDKVCMEIPQYMELFTMLDKNQRRLITLDKGKRYLIKRLYYLSCPNFIPPNYLNEKDIKAEDVLFDLKTIQYLRLNLLPFTAKTAFPKKIFISRSKASGRRQFNEDEVFQVFEKYGFKTVHPENYTIKDQMAMFNNAEFIAGGSGAAFTNLLFCKKSCKVVIFMKKMIPFSGFSTIGRYIGIEMLYFTEDLNSIDDVKDIHESFQINSEKLNTFIADWIQQ